MICQKCGHTLQKHEKFCGRCGANYQSERLKSTLHTSAEHVKATYAKASTQATEMRHQFSQELANASEPLRCERCQTAIQTQDKFCKKCGAPRATTATQDIARSVAAVTQSEAMQKTTQFGKTVLAAGQAKAKDCHVAMQNMETDDLKIQVKETKVTLFQQLRRHRFKIIGLILLLLLGLFSTKLIASPRPERAVDALFTLIENQDAKELRQVLFASDPGITILELDAQEIVDYYYHNPSVLNRHRENLKAVVDQRADNITPFTLLNPDAKKQEEYRWQLALTTLTVTHDLENVEIGLYRGHNPIIESVTNQMSIPWLTPGEYTFEVRSTQEFAPFSHTVELTLFDGKADVTFPLDLTLHETVILSEEPDATIYINGVNTNQTAAELGTIQGLEYGSEIYGIFDYRNNFVKSNVVTVADQKELVLVYEYDTMPTVLDAEVALSDLMKRYLEGFASAVNRGEYRLIAPYLKPNSDIANQQESYILSLYKRGFKEEFVLHHIAGFEYDPQRFTGWIEVTESYKIDNPEKEHIETVTYTNRYDFEYLQDTETFVLTSVETQ